MQAQDKSALLRATIEEELGSFRHFADLPATEIEDMTARIMRAIGGFFGEDGADICQSRAA